MAFAGAVEFSDGSPPRVVELKVVDELGMHDAVLIVCGETAQIHWVGEPRCPHCRQKTHESRWVDFVPFSYFSSISHEIPTAPCLAYALAFQIFQLEVDGYVKVNELRRIGFSEMEAG